MSVQFTSSSALKGKTSIITAGNKGGGAAIAMRFFSAGANVAIVAPKSVIKDESVNEVSNKIIELGGNSKTWEVDFSNYFELDNTVSEIGAHFGAIDIVINNYSTFNFKSSIGTTSEEFHKVIGNIFTTFFFSKACIPFLKNSRNPHVINIAPPLDMESAKEACKHHLLFSISKYGMSFCTMGMAEEFKKCSIAFNSLWQERPVSTATLANNFSNEVIRGSNRPEIYAEAAYLIALKSSKDFSGNYCIDEQLLIENGIDVKIFAVDSTARPIKDIFLPGADYEVLKPILKS